MTTVELTPSLAQCIETVAKKEYHDAASRYLRDPASDPALGERIEILRVFLETADFGALRRQSEPGLIEGRQVKFILHFEGAELRYRMLVT